jgi:hypothetical protein
MKTIVSFKPKAIMAIFLSMTMCLIVSFFLLNSLNFGIVHLKLYDYGLRFDSLWANEYWKYLYILIASIMTNCALVILSFFSLVLYIKKRVDGSRVLSSVFVALSFFASIFSVALFVFIDNIVNGNLYNFGLQFSNTWFDSYSWYFIGFVSLQAIIMSLSITSFLLISFGNKSFVKVSLSKITFTSLIAVGSVLIGLSILYNYIVSLFAGLGLVFWGTIMTYVSSDKFIKKEVFEATSLSYFSSLNEILDRVEIKNVIYMPSKNAELKNEIPLEDNDEKEKTLIYAPGMELFNLFEKTLGTNFAKHNFSFFERAIPKILVDLELAQNAKIEAEGDIVTVTLDNPFDTIFLLKAKQYSRALDSIGIPLSSAIAIALAHSTGKPVVIKSHLISPEAKIVEIEYVTLPELRVEV